jgi:hypothetical protein
MNGSVHQQAQQLSVQSLVEGLTPQEQAWLDAHLRECGNCARKLASTRELLDALRRVPVAVPRDLAARTQLRVRLRAQQSTQAPDNGAILWIITGASWVLGILSAPFVWRVFAWIGLQLNVPKPVLEFGFLLWWTVPALVAVGAVLYQRALSTSHGSRRISAENKSH